MLSPVGASTVTRRGLPFPARPPTIRAAADLDGKQPNITRLTAFTTAISAGTSRDRQTTATGHPTALWDTTDLATTHDLGPPATVPEMVPEMRFAPDDRTLTTIDLKGGITPWDLTGVVGLQDNAVRQACGITGTGLNEEAWARPVPGLPYQAKC